MHASQLRADTASIVAGPRLALFTLCLAVLVAQLDTAVVNLAAHPIGEYFQAALGAQQWVVDSYNLVYAAMLLTAGLLADLLGRRRLFMVGAAVFTVASLLCASAPSVAFLIAARALAGLGAAFIIPASLAIIRVVWQDGAARGRALGIWAACNGVALAIGPTLGGVLIRHFGWRSIFLVVVPVSVAAMPLALLSIPETADPQGRHLDLPGQTLGAVALGALAFAAIAAHEEPSLAAAAAAAAILFFALFIGAETRRAESALVPLDMFRSRAFSGAMAATAAMTFGMYGLIFLLPLSWQSTGRLDATAAGLALMPMALVFVLVSPLSGKLAERLGGRFMTAGGVAIIGCGLILIGVTAGRTSLVPAEIGLAMTGLGMGLATGQLMEAAVSAVNAARSGTAASLINAARMTGATLGVAAAGTVFALTQGGTHDGGAGLRSAMLLGGFVQLSGAAVAWRAMGTVHRPDH